MSNETLNLKEINNVPFTTRNACIKDIDRLAELHLLNANSYDLSAVLGLGFIKKFYATCVADSDTTIKLIVNKTGNIVGASVVFFSYRRFIKRYKKSALPQLVATLAKLTLTLRLVKLKYIFSLLKQPDFSACFPDYSTYDKHVGYFFLDTKFRSDTTASTVFFNALNSNIQSLLNSSSSGVWGSTFACNKPTVRLLKLLGFLEITRIKSYNKEVIVFYKSNTGAI